MSLTHTSCGHDHSASFVFDIEVLRDELLKRAAFLHAKGKVLNPFYKFTTSSGTPVLDVESKILESDEDLRASFFEMMLLASSLERTFMCFYYVPLIDLNSDDFLISMIMLDTNQKMLTNSNYEWNSITEEFEVGSNDKNLDSQTLKVPTNVLQSIICALGFTDREEHVFTYDMMKNYLMEEGYVIKEADGVNSNNILQIMTTMNYNPFESKKENEQS